MIFPARTLLRLAAILALAAPAGAFAQGTEEQQQACTPDALKLCSDTIPDIGKTTACMKAHFAQLSPRCQSAFNSATGSAPTRSAARESEPRHREATRHVSVERERAPLREARRPEAREVERDVVPPPVPGFPAFPSPDAPIVRADQSDSSGSGIVRACRDGLIDSYTCEHTVPALLGTE